MDQRLAERLSPFLPGLRAGSLVDGQIVAGNGAPVTLIDPASGREILSYGDAGEDVAKAAVSAAARASGHWRAMTASERGRIIWSIGAKVRAQINELAEIETLSTGKPIRDTRAEVSKVAEMFEYYAGWADKIEGDVIPVPTSHLNYVCREPFGV
ncbi:MAG: aldehyde dehydrogenase family protein, partial [Beijerinckiaceae bacterium]